MRHKTGLYLRVSTEEQAQVVEGSLESQKHRLLGFVDLKNLQEPGWGKVVETYTDEGLSAKDTRRPAFQRMMKDVRSGKINLILVTDLSRLSRSISDFCVLLDDLKKASAKFLSLKEQFDTSTPAGEMMVFNMINLAQFERKQTSERVAMNFHARALRGLRNGGHALLGFEVDPTNPGKYLIHPAEAAQVRKIFAIYREECSLKKTIAQMSAEGLHPKVRLTRRDRHNLAGRWSIASLANFLRTHAYAGLREINAKNKNHDQESLRNYERHQFVKASWEPIVDLVEFNAVQRILDENLSRERKRLATGDTRTFLLSGIFYCKECGRPLVGSSGHGRNRIHRYYVHRALAGEPVTCQLKTINAEEIEKKVLNHLDEILFREGYLDRIEHRMEIIYNQDHGDLKTRIKNCEIEIARTEREIRATIRLITEMPEDGMDEVLRETLKALKDQKIEKETLLKELRRQSEELNSAKEDRKVIELCAAEVRKAKTKATPATLKRLIQKLVSAITISSEGANMGYWKAKDGLHANPSTENKKAPDQKSGVCSVISLGHRRLEKIQDFHNLPPLPSEHLTKLVVGGYVVKNGGPTRT